VVANRLLSTLIGSPGFWLVAQERTRKRTLATWWQGDNMPMDIENGWVQAITGGYRFGTNNQFDRAV